MYNNNNYYYDYSVVVYGRSEYYVPSNSLQLCNITKIISLFCKYKIISSNVRFHTLCTCILLTFTPDDANINLSNVRQIKLFYICRSHLYVGSGQLVTGNF